WRTIYRALRLMELSGEVVSGLFVRDAGSPQYARLDTLESLAQPPEPTPPYWINATDPASPAGILAAAYGGKLPQRVPSTHLVIRGTRLIGISRRLGKDIEILVPPDDADAAAIVLPLRAMVSRQVRPRSSVKVEQVNGVPVRESEYAQLLRENGFRDEYRAFVLSASYR
ncbi:MAG: hypothetical protein ACLFP4_16115, partial [Spirochaetales bacterium]